MLDKHLTTILTDVWKEAREKGYTYVTLELIAKHIIKDPAVLSVLTEQVVNIEGVKLELNVNIDARSLYASSTSIEPIPNSEVKRLLRKALSLKVKYHYKALSPLVLFLAIFKITSISDNDTVVYDVFYRNGLDLLALETAVRDDRANRNMSDLSTDSLYSTSYLEESPNNKDSQIDKSLSFFTEEQQAVIDKYCTNLTEQARNNILDPLIGRTEELKQLIEIMCQRKKHNPILLGEAGVGKTAIIEGLAQLIVKEEVPARLLGLELLTVDMNALTAGTMYRGDFEKNVENLLGVVSETKSVILFFDEAHSMVKLGSSSAGNDLSNILKPYLTKDWFYCIGATTHAEYRKYIEKDTALSRRFNPVIVNELTKEETKQLIHRVKSKLESYHELTYSDEAIDSIVNLSDFYIKSQYLPDKALTLLDKAGAAAATTPGVVIQKQDIERLISRILKLPDNSLSKKAADSIVELKEHLENTIFGQSKAISTVTDLFALDKAGLRNKQKPIASVLFMGPTGVGKTEICKQVAEKMHLKFLRFDMSEYGESHTISKLIGSPPGYVGYEDGGKLAELVNRNPQAVILLDEIEKAHPSIYNVLLQIMDYGFMTDAQGNKIDFRHTFIVMTSNVGTFEAQKVSIGFLEDKVETASGDAMKKLFSPEFRNRLSAVVQFNSLGEASMSPLINKLIEALNEILSEKNVTLDVTREGIEYLMKHGYSKELGARPMEALVQQKINLQIANAVLFGELKHGGHVTVTVDNDALVINTTTRILEA